MLRLTTLGGVLLSRDGATVTWLQRGWQRGALFALLAATGKKGVDRELLATLLWPDSDEALARHSLDELLSRVRRELECKQLFSGTASIAFNTQEITNDLDDFQDAVASEHFERAVALYEGPFADGLRLSSAQEAERRIDVMRVRSADAYLRSLVRLAERCTERGDASGAVGWWQRAVESDPLSMRFNKALLNALMQAGELGRAHAHLRVFRTLLQGELGITPDTEILAFELRLKTKGSASEDPLVPPPAFQHERHESAVFRVRRAPHVERFLAPAYEVKELIGESSSIATFELISRPDGAKQALHIVHSHIGGAREAHRFNEVFGRVASLSHPNIVPVVSSGVVEGTAFWISTVAPRQTLRETLRRERTTSLSQTLSMLAMLSLALRHAHARSVFHGDVRPRRVSVAGERIMLTGFGLVEALANNQSANTMESTIVSMGSPLYQSPEQLCERAGADAGSDIYAFGCIAYEMLTGQRPFGSEPGIAMVRQKLAGVVTPLRELRNTVPPEVERAVMRCLASVAGDRGDEVPMLEYRPD